MDNKSNKTPLSRIEALLKSELSLALRLYEQAETQRKALKENLNGKAVTDATDAIESTLRELDACEKNKTELLSELGAETIEDALGRMPYSKEKTRARQYMNRLSGLLDKLRTLADTNRDLLARDMDYLAFSLNVMTAASAAPGYGTPDTPAQGTQGRKLFDQSI